jgi:hypothetical protein
MVPKLLRETEAARSGVFLHEVEKAEWKRVECKLFDMPVRD